MRSEALLPCPFCGGPALYDLDRWVHSVFCPDTTCCEVSTKHFMTKTEAIAAWNTRTEAPQQ